MKKGMGWPIGIVVLLAASVVGNIAVIVITREDPSFAVEPDYYRKAVDWDSTQARLARSDALGWNVSAVVRAADSGMSVLTLTLRDRGGVVVHNAALSGELLHVARANDVQSLVFAERADGEYSTTVPMQRAGMWELRLAAVRNNERFVETLRIETQPDVRLNNGP